VLHGTLRLGLRTLGSRKHVPNTGWPPRSSRREQALELPSQWQSCIPAYRNNALHSSLVTVWALWLVNVRRGDTGIDKIVAPATNPQLDHLLNQSFHHLGQGTRALRRHHPVAEYRLEVSWPADTRGSRRPLYSVSAGPFPSFWNACKPRRRWDKPCTKYIPSGAEHYLL
jgi:hypothetical protein